MSTTVAPASIAEDELGQLERANATAATPVASSLATGHGWRELADTALPFVKRSA